MTRLALARRVSFFALAAAVASIGGAALAQTEAATTPNPAAKPPAKETAAQPEVGVEQLVVTAERRVTNLQTTAVAATVLSGKDLQKKSVISLDTLQFAVPNVIIDYDGSANVFNIRGIGRSQVDVDLPSGVVIYQDGVPTVAGYFQNEPYFDIQSIEVLRGPQGTFEGQSASGGAVYIRTQDPQLNSFGGSVQAGVGNYNQGELTGILNVPVTDDLAIRLSYNHLNRSSFYNLYGPYTGHPDRHELDSVRFYLRWDPTNNLDIVLKNDFSNLDFGGNPTSSYGDPLFHIYQDAPFKYLDRSERTVLSMKYKFNDGITLTSLTGFQQIATTNDLDLNGSTPYPRYWFLSHGDVYLYSQEFDLVSPDTNRFRWVLGAFLSRQILRVPNWHEGGFEFVGGDVFGPQLPLTYPWATTPARRVEDNIAAFAHASYDVTPTLSLEVGARYSHYALSQYTDLVYGFGDAPPVTPYPSVPPVAPGGDYRSYSEGQVDWKVALNWKVAPDHFLYALVARGHTSGGINLFPPGQSYAPMIVTDYEGGWKGSFADGKIQTQLGPYYETFKNYQASFADINLPANSGFQDASSPSVVYGVEFSGQAALGQLRVDFGMAYLHSRLGTFQGIVNPFTGAVVNLTGSQSPFSPSFSGNIGVQYTFRLNDKMTLTPRADFAYIGATQAGLFNTPLITLVEHRPVNLQLTLNAQDGWSAVAWMTNATNELYAGGIQNNGTLRYAAPPRQYGLRISKTF